MKYFLVLAAALAVTSGCFPPESAESGSAKAAKQSNKSSGSAAAQKNYAALNTDTDGVIDEEFDLLIAPEYNYETDIPYAEQIKNNPPAAPAVKGAKKPAKRRASGK